MITATVCWLCLFPAWQDREPTSWKQIDSKQVLSATNDHTRAVLSVYKAEIAGAMPGSAIQLRLENKTKPGTGVIVWEKRLRRLGALSNYWYSQRHLSLTPDNRVALIYVTDLGSLIFREFGPINVNARCPDPPILEATWYPDVYRTLTTTREGNITVKHKLEDDLKVLFAPFVFKVESFGHTKSQWRVGIVVNAQTVDRRNTFKNSKFFLVRGFDDSKWQLEIPQDEKRRIGTASPLFRP